MSKVKLYQIVIVHSLINGVTGLLDNEFSFRPAIFLPHVIRVHCRNKLDDRLSPVIRSPASRALAQGSRDLGTALSISVDVVQRLSSSPSTRRITHLGPGGDTRQLTFPSICAGEIIWDWENTGVPIVQKYGPWAVEISAQSEIAQHAPAAVQSTWAAGL